MAFLADLVLDSGLYYLVDNGIEVHICTGLPNTYGTMTAASLGSATGLTVGNPENGDANGRKVVIPAMTGIVVASETGRHWALSNGSDELLAAEALGANQVVTSGNSWTLPNTDVTFPDPS